MRKLVVLALLMVSAAAYAGAQATKNGFALVVSSIPVDEILEGGPARDAIPALFDPQRVAAEESPWSADEWVVGVVVGEEAAAYPVAILAWHELVNDTLGDEPILVSYCPLCGTAMVFDRRAGGTTHVFGVSGLLYRSDLLLYDRGTESLWSQIRSEAVTGTSIGQRLRLLRSRMMRWQEWRALHPRTTILSRDTGHARAYERAPYGDYATSEALRFPVPSDRRYHPKTPTLGIRFASGSSRAYPAIELVRAGGTAEERVAGRKVRVTYDVGRETFSVEAPPEAEIIEGYWFAWMAFHPDSSVFTAPAP